MKNSLQKLILASTKKHLPFFLAASFFCFLSLSLVIFVNGWPMNHEFQQFFIRTYVWADHIRAGDLLPIWSSSDAYGYGTPLPMYYQKLFHVINAGFFLVVDSIKLATVMTLYVFMMTSVYGLRAAMRYLVTNKYIINMLPLIFPLCSYVMTDWFVRGAMAEMSALVIVPWVIWWCLKIIKTNEVSYWIILIFPALFYAHNAIALISLIFIGISIILLITRWAQLVKLLQSSWRKIVICCVGIVALIVPSLVLQSMMSRDYNPAEKIDDIYNIAGSFQKPINYLFDRDYIWLQNWGGYTVQIDTLLWFSVAILGLLVVGYRIYKKKNIIPRDLGLQVVLLSLLVYVFLQLEIAQPIYETIHTLALIQFPWRMLSIISPLLILLLAVLIGHVEMLINSKNRRIVCIPLAMWLVLYVVLSPIVYDNNVAKMNIAYYPKRAIYAGGEYLPITYTPQGELIGNKDMLTMYSKLSSSSPGVSITEVDGTKEVMVRNFRVYTDGNREISLPISYSRYAKVFINGIPIDTRRNLQDPRLFITVPGGSVDIRVELPTTLKLIQAALDL